MHVIWPFPVKALCNFHIIRFRLENIHSTLIQIHFQIQRNAPLQVLEAVTSIPCFCYYWTSYCAQTQSWAVGCLLVNSRFINIKPYFSQTCRSDFRMCSWHTATNHFFYSKCIDVEQDACPNYTGIDNALFCVTSTTHRKCELDWMNGFWDMQKTYIQRQTESDSLLLSELYLIRWMVMWNLVERKANKSN